MRRTVDEVIDESDEPLKPPRTGLFSRKKLADTEELYAQPEKEATPKEPEEQETIGPEPDLTDEAENGRRLSIRSGKPLTMTQSRGSFTLHFARYEDCPPAAQEKAIAEAKALAEAE